MHLRRIIVLGAGLAAIAAGSARASDHAAKTAVATAPRPASAAALVAWKPRAWMPVATSGMRVAIDPVDGVYSMPPPDETAHLMIDRDAVPVAVTQRADGSIRAQLDERWANYAMVTMGPDGKPHWTCVQGSAQAAKFMRNPPPAPAPGTVWEEK